MSIDYTVHLWRWFGSVPWLVVVMAGAVLCVLHCSRNPRAATLVGIALAIEVGSFFVMPFVSQYIFSIFDATQISELSGRILFNSVLLSIPNAISLGLLLWAVFGAPRARTGEWSNGDVSGGPGG